MQRVTCAFIFGLFTTTALSAEVTVCIENQAYPPVINGTNTVPKDNPGDVVLVAQTAAKHLNIDLGFIRRPWARCLQMASQGKVDGILPSIKTTERSALYRFPDNDEHFLSKAGYPIFYRISDEKAEFYEALARAKNKSSVTHPELKYGIAAPFGYIAYDLLKELKLLSNHDYSVHKGLEMVANNKLDGYVVINSIGQNKAKELAIDERLTATQFPLLQENLYVVFNKAFYANNKEKIDAFWRQLAISRQTILGY